MEDLVVWLRQQLDEDERVARAATAGPWSATDNRCVVDAGGPLSELRGYVVCSVGAYARSVPTEQDAEHIARHDPARVLREVEAKRLLLDDLMATTHFLDDSEWYGCASIRRSDGRDVPTGRPCTCGRDDDVARRVRLLALPYSGRPGYREEWKP